MLSIAAIAVSAEDAARYYCDENKLSKEDYYVNGQDPPGYWYGGASLNLSGEVLREDFSHLLRGELPKDGGVLVPRGGKEYKHHPGWDLTFSAPKSVSIAYARSDEETKEKIRAAHDHAVRSALDYLKEDILSAAVRRVRREGGERKEFREAPKEIIAACFNHKTSRELDPQLHTHAVVLNVAMREDATWGTLKLKQAFTAKKAIGAAYRAELAHILRHEVGLAVGRDREFFRVTAVPKSLEKDFSKRRQQILFAMKTRGETGAISAAKATLLTRANKAPLDHDILGETWRKEMDKDGFTATIFEDQNELAKRAPERRQTDKEKRLDLIASAVHELTERSSTFTKEQVAQKAFEAGQCQQSTREIRLLIDALESHGDIVKLRRADFKELFTSKTILAIEKQMRTDAIALSKNESHGVDSTNVGRSLADYEQSKGVKLTYDQRKAVEHAMTPKQIAAIEGVAGAGKSFAMGAVRHAYERAGYNVRGLAPTGIAAQNLTESGIESMTMDRYFHNKNDLLSNKDVVICDEMGMVGSRRTARLLAEVRASGAKIIMVGESSQLQPIDAGGAFRAITNAISRESITKIFRQKEVWQRNAVELLRAGNATEALELYDTHGALRVAESESSLKTSLVKEYVSYHAQNEGKSQVALSRNNADVNELNHGIRTALQKEGFINAKEYAATVETRMGRIERSFAKGDKIVFLKNDAELGVMNGTIAQVVKVIPDERGGARYVQATGNGKNIYVDLFRYDKIDHAYALTIHKAQGSTVDRVLIHGSANLDRESAYVASSRQRESILLFCSLTSFGKDLSMNYEPLFRQKEEVLKDELKPELSKVFTKSMQKDTSLEYEALEPLATKRLKEIAGKLTGHFNKEQLVLIGEIATTQGAAKGLLADPSPAPWVTNARDILKNSSINKIANLKTYLESLKLGYEPAETAIFIARRKDLEKTVRPLLASHFQKVEVFTDGQNLDRQSPREVDKEIGI